MILIKTLKILFSLLCFVSCAVQQTQKINLPKNNKFYFKDTTGEYVLEKDIQLNKEKIISRDQIISRDNVVLEKTISLTQVGKVSNNQIALRPWASDFTVWFDQKKHQSKSRLDIKNRELDYSIFRPEGTKTKTFTFPSGTFFCYFAQIPECLIYSGYLKKIISDRSTLDFIIVWPNYPFANEQYERIPNEPFTIAKLAYENKQKDHHVLELSFSGQILFYHFAENFRFDKMYWIAQGISIERQEK